MPKGVYPRKPRPPKQYPQAIVAEVRALYAGGHTQAEVGALVGLSQRVVHTLMKHHGVDARVAAKRNQWGNNNHAWKGNEASYQAFHRRLYSCFGKPSKCTACGTEDAEHYDYANLSGRYEDLDDYAAMCRSCHWKMDDKILNISHVRETRHA